MNIFERYLTLWVALAIVVGIVLGAVAREPMTVISSLEFNTVNIPVALLIWLMIYPMMLKIDFSKITDASHYREGLTITVVANWLIKPFTMFLFASLFFGFVFKAWISPELAKQYLAGAILLGAAPCTAMVFVWSDLTDGDANFTISQVAINDLIILIAFVPIVGLLLGMNDISIPYGTLITSVIVFVVIPLLAGVVSKKVLLKAKGLQWYQEVYVPFWSPVSMLALLSTLVLLFAFQGDTILSNPFHILLIAVPLAIQTVFIFAITWKAGRLRKLPHNIVSPSAMIGASNFFELSVAVAIALFGLSSGAALVTVVGVLIEVPIMLALVSYSNKHTY